MGQMGLLTFPGKYFESHDKSLLLEDYELEMIPSEQSPRHEINRIENIYENPGSLNLVSKFCRRDYEKLFRMS